MDLSGKVAIVTGAGKGLGWAIAERLARDGAHLVLAEVDRASGEEKATIIRKMGREALALPTDVTRWADVEKMVVAFLS